jgi:hypothetical protein
MPSQIKENLKVIIVAMVTALVTAAGTALAFNVAPAIAHGVKHAKFAHNADKVDGKHANQLRSIAEGRSYSYVGPSPIQTVNATPENLVQFSFNAPRKGYAHVTLSHADFALADQRINSWAEIDPAADCDQTSMIRATETFDTMLNGTYASPSSSAIIPVSKGSHRLILCAVAAAGGVQVGVASLTATFIPAGQVSISTPPAPRNGPEPKFGR